MQNNPVVKSDGGNLLLAKARKARLLRSARQSITANRHRREIAFLKRVVLPTGKERIGDKRLGTGRSSAVYLVRLNEEFDRWLNEDVQEVLQLQVENSIVKSVSVDEEGVKRIEDRQEAAARAKLDIASRLVSHGSSASAKERSEKEGALWRDYQFQQQARKFQQANLRKRVAVLAKEVIGCQVLRIRSRQVQNNKDLLRRLRVRMLHSVSRRMLRPMQELGDDDSNNNQSDETWDGSGDEYEGQTGSDNTIAPAQHTVNNNNTASTPSSGVVPMRQVSLSITSSSWQNSDVNVHKT